MTVFRPDPLRLIFFRRDSVRKRVVGVAVSLALGTSLIVGNNIYSRSFDGTPVDPVAVPLLESVSLLIMSMAFVLIAAGLYNLARAVWLAGKGRW